MSVIVYVIVLPCILGCFLCVTNFLLHYDCIIVKNKKHKKPTESILWCVNIRKKPKNFYSHGKSDNVSRYMYVQHNLISSFSLSNLKKRFKFLKKKRTFYKLVFSLFAERNLNPKAACLKRREEEKTEELPGGRGGMTADDLAAQQAALSGKVRNLLLPYSSAQYGQQEDGDMEDFCWVEFLLGKTCYSDSSLSQQTSPNPAPITSFFSSYSLLVY